jgi:hypothetical protein
MAFMKSVAVLLGIGLVLGVGVVALWPEGAGRDWYSSGTYTLPLIGEEVQLPPTDMLGQEIPTDVSAYVLVLPDCGGCSLKHVNLDVLLPTADRPVICIFPDMNAASEGLPTSVALRRAHRFILDEAPRLQYANLLPLAPFAIGCDPSQRIDRLMAPGSRVDAFLRGDE